MPRRLYLGGWKIYILKDPDTQEVRYVGVTDDIISRLEFHLQFAYRRTSPVAIWVYDLLQKGKEPLIEVVDSGTGDYSTCEFVWITKHKSAQLLNIDNGGSGRQRKSVEHRKKLSEAQLGQVRGPRAEETKKLLSVRMKAIWAERRARGSRS